MIEQVFGQMVIAFVATAAICACIFLLGYSRQIYAGEKKHEVVQDPRYGVALWHYFQGENLQALTELMVAEDITEHITKGKTPIQGHGDNPKIMKAALELAYGMVNHSKAAFDAIADESLSPSIKGKAWYYLASIYYQRGDLNNALSSLENSMGLDTSANLNQNPKALSLKLNILIQQTDFFAAEKLLGSVKSTFTDRAITLFNLGNAYSRKSEYTTALNTFDRALKAIKQQEKISQADLLLADKIYTSAGYSALFSAQPQLALSYFSQSQQQTLDSELALLGYGRAAVELEDYQQALALFGRLAQKASYKPAVQESLISVPTIYEQVQQPGKALRAYEYAITAYQQEISDIDADIAQLGQQNLANLFSEKTANKQNSHWLKSPRGNSVSVSSLNQQKFSGLFSESKFQHDLRELQDLVSLNDLAVARLDRLSMLKESLVSRQKSRQSQWLQYGALQAEQKLQAYKSRLKEMKGSLQKSVDEKDYLTLIPNNRKELLERIKHSERRIDAHNQQGAGLQKQKNLLRIYKGMLFWQAAQDYSKEKYALEKAIEDMEQELDVLASNQSRVETILATDFQERQAEYQTGQTERQSQQTEHLPDMASTSEVSYFLRIEQLERNTASIASHLDQKIAEAKAKVFGSMVALLEGRKQKLRRYLTHARLASLRIYEEGNLAVSKSTLKMEAELGSDSHSDSVIATEAITKAIVGARP